MHPRLPACTECGWSAACSYAPFIGGPQFSTPCRPPIGPTPSATPRPEPMAAASARRRSTQRCIARSSTTKNQHTDRDEGMTRQWHRFHKGPLHTGPSPGPRKCILRFAASESGYKHDRSVLRLCVVSGNSMGYTGEDVLDVYSVPSGGGGGGGDGWCVSEVA